eukprot:178602-Chlamydomonas_euryale.AAC.1
MCQDAGRLNEAEPLLRKALERRVLVLGPSHPDSLSSINNLAVLLQVCEWVAGGVLALGPSHPDSLDQPPRGNAAGVGVSRVGMTSTRTQTPTIAKVCSLPQDTYPRTSTPTITNTKATTEQSP